MGPTYCGQTFFCLDARPLTMDTPMNYRNELAGRLYQTLIASDPEAALDHPARQAQRALFLADAVQAAHRVHRSAWRCPENQRAVRARTSVSPSALTRETNERIARRAGAPLTHQRPSSSGLPIRRYPRLDRRSRPYTRTKAPLPMRAMSACASPSSIWISPSKVISAFDSGCSQVRVSASVITSAPTRRFSGFM